MLCSLLTIYYTEKQVFCGLCSSSWGDESDSDSDSSSGSSDDFRPNRGIRPAPRRTTRGRRTAGRRAAPARGGRRKVADSSSDDDSSDMEPTRASARSKAKKVRSVYSDSLKALPLFAQI